VSILVIFVFVSSFCSYEEENFVRLTVSKNQQRKARATSAQDTLNSLLHFGDYGLNDDAGKKQVCTLYFAFYGIVLYSRYEIEILEKVKVENVDTRNRSRKALVVDQRRNDKYFSVITVSICFVIVLVVVIV
jgi:hypothetical protein